MKVQGTAVPGVVFVLQYTYATYDNLKGSVKKSTDYECNVSTMTQKIRAQTTRGRRVGCW